MAFDFSYVMPPTGVAENAIVREMFDDLKAYVNTLVPSGSAAPVDAQYVTLTTNATLTAERVLTAGSGIQLTDNGAGSTVVVDNIGVLSLATSNINSSFSHSTGNITFSFSTTPTFSSLIFQSASGAIGIAPSGSVFTSYNLTLPLDTGSNGYILTTNGATPTATLSWSNPATGFVTDIHGTTNQISVSSTVGSVTLSTPQDIATSSAVQFANVKVGAGLVSDVSLKINDTDSGFYQASGGAGFINLALNGAIGTVWTPSDQMLNNSGPVKAISFIAKNGSGNTVTIQPSSSFSNYTLTLPTDDGTANQFLQTDGSGVLTWADFSSLGATKALDNLASVAINTSLLPSSNNSIDLGSSSKTWRDLYIGAFISFRETSATTDTITIQAPTDITTSYGLILPALQGGSNTFLRNDGSGNLTWVSATAGGAADTALDNLSAVAINTSLFPGTDNSIDLGSSSKTWKDIYSKGQLKLLATSNHIALSTAANKAIISVASQATSDRTFTINDISGNGTFAFLEGTQTFSGSKTFSSAVTVQTGLGTPAVLIGADEGAGTLTNSTTKYGLLGFPHYTNAQAAIAALSVESTSTDNIIRIGGGQPTGNPTTATAIRFFTASNNTTTTGGTFALEINATNVVPKFAVTAPDGSASAPSYSFASSPDLGFFRVGANEIGISMGNSDQFRIKTGVIYPTSDNIRSMGQSGNRWSAVWAGNGTIQTSMSNTKTNLQLIDEDSDFICKVPQPALFTRPNEDTSKVRLGWLADTLPTEAHPMLNDGTRSIEDVYTDSILAMHSLALRRDYKRFAEQELRIKTLEARLAILEAK